MMTTRWDILGIGTAAVDDLLFVEHFPQPDTKSPVMEYSRQGGGQTATALVAAARHGMRAAFCCRLGMDDLSQFTTAELEKEGVDCSPCARLEDGSPYHSFIIIDHAEATRTILHIVGKVMPPLESITPELIGGCRVLFLDHNMHQAGIQAARIARMLGIPVVADIENIDALEAEALLPLVDHLILGTRMASQLSNKSDEDGMAAALGGKQRAVCIVTAGSRGCWFTERGGPVRHLPAFKVPVVDTTGCGDVFHGVYAAALARGEAVMRAVMLASASAALKATRPGGRLGIPDLRTVERFLEGECGDQTLGTPHP